MAPSAIYLERLDQFQTNIAYMSRVGMRDVIPDAWRYLIDAYTDDSYTARLDRYYALVYLARAAAREYLQTTNTPLESFIKDMRDLHVRKNAGYAGDDPDPWKNFRAVEVFGISAADGCLTRLSDKYARWCVLKDNPEKDLVNESIADTLMDMVAYCLILICLLEEGHATV